MAAKYSRERKIKFYEYWYKTYKNFNCYYCDKATYVTNKVHSNYQHNKRTIDHVVARALGGTNERKNLVLSCEECNNKKSVEEQKLYYKKLAA